MFFIHSMGRRSKQSTTNTLEELGEKVTKLMASEANDAIVVSVGKTDQAVMPYVWIRRNDADKWEGELGDCIKLGIDDGLLIEHDPIQMLNLEQAVAAGIAEVYEDFHHGPVVSVDPPAPVLAKKAKKLSNEEKVVESRRMIEDLFKDIRDEDFDLGGGGLT